MEENQEILDARAKLQAKFQSRIGGKGTTRRKVKAKSTTLVVQDDKKIQASFKKLGLNPIPGIEEVNMFTQDSHVIHFKEPKVMASLQANTYTVSGVSEVRPLQEVLPKVINQMGNENLMNLRKVMEESVGSLSNEKEAEEDDIPDLDDTNFEEVSKE